ncbi:MAG: hypothetical protein NTY46_02910 [Candidatus Sumerlaeota bacterium]|nr:hypothetical protein [Candidatus Sumerlaeota bacterium]
MQKKCFELTAWDLEHDGAAVRAMRATGAGTRKAEFWNQVADNLARYQGQIAAIERQMNSPNPPVEIEVPETMAALFRPDLDWTEPLSPMRPPEARAISGNARFARYSEANFKFFFRQVKEIRARNPGMSARQIAVRMREMHGIAIAPSRTTIAEWLRLPDKVTSI